MSRNNADQILRRRCPSSDCAPQEYLLRGAFGLSELRSLSALPRHGFRFFRLATGNARVDIGMDLSGIETRCGLQHLLTRCLRIADEAGSPLERIRKFQ